MIRAALVPLALAALLPGAAQADTPDLAPDFAVLFQTHAGDVMQATPGTRRLELPGPVVIEEITRGGETTYRATDQSGQGALLCQLDALLWAGLVANTCPGLFSSDEAERLTGMTYQAALFAGAHTVPPLGAEAATQRLRAMARDMARRARIACPEQDAPEAAMLRAITGPAAQIRLRQSLSLPRLPVHHPCE